MQDLEALATQRAAFLASLESADEQELTAIEASLAASGSSESSLRRAFLALLSNNFERAATLLEEAAPNSNDAFACFLRASLCVRGESFGEAIAHISQVEIPPFLQDEAALLRTAALSHLGQFQALLDQPDDANLQDKTRATIFAMKGYAARQIGDHQRALELVRRCKRFFPGMPSLQLHLATM